jgi:hypothetical protein
MKHSKVKQAIVTKGVWKATETAVTPYIEFLSKITSLPPDKAERLVILLAHSNGHNLTHRGFVRGVKTAIKAGHQGLDKYLPGYVAPGSLESVMAAD